jgi:hypothetical protein
MDHADWQTAKAVARGLVNRETDVNEVQKVLAYARMQAILNQNRVGANFFSLLETMSRDGRYLVRSGRTLDYYRNLREVCGQYLKDYKGATGERGEKLVEILGWAARLMRYYNTEAGKEELAAPQITAETSQLGREKLQAAHRPKEPELVKPVLHQAPACTEKKRELVTVITAPKGGKAQVRTAQGEEVPCSNLPVYPPAKPGDTCRAEVAYEGGRPVRAVFKGWK